MTVGCIEALPLDVLSHIFKQGLKPKDLFNVSLVCKRFKEGALQSLLWKAIYQQCFPLSFRKIEQVGKGLDYVSLFKERRAIEKSWRNEEPQICTLYPRHPVYSLQFKEDLLVFGSVDNTLYIYDLKKKKHVGTLCIKENKQLTTVDCLQFENERLVTGGEKQGIRLWDLSTGQIVQTLDAPHTTDLKFEKNMLISASDDFTAQLWDLSTGKSVHTFKEHTGPVTCLDFDRSRLVTGSADNTVCLWDLSTRKKVSSLAHYSQLSDVQLAGDRLATASQYVLHLWDLLEAPAKEIFVHYKKNPEYHFTCLQFEAGRVVVGSADNAIYLWQPLEKCHLVQDKTRVFSGHLATVYCLQFEGRRLVSGSIDHTVRIWDFGK